MSHARFKQQVGIHDSMLQRIGAARSLTRLT